MTVLVIILICTLLLRIRTEVANVTEGYALYYLDNAEVVRVAKVE